MQGLKSMFRAIAAALLIAPTLSAAGPADTSLAVLDEAIGRLRRGEVVSAQMQAQCTEAYSRMGEALLASNNVNASVGFAEPGRTDYYLATIKIFIIQPDTDPAWFTYTSLSSTALPEIKKRLKNAPSPWLDAALIIPAVYQEDKASAAESYARLQSDDPFLARRVTEWMFRIFSQPLWQPIYYAKQNQDAKAQAALTWLQDFCFPKGMKRADIGDLIAVPQSGVRLLGESKHTLKYGVKSGDVIVAAQGYLVENELQYFFLREREWMKGYLGPNDRHNLIIWNGDSYREISTDLPGQRFGVLTTDYVPDASAE